MHHQCQSPALLSRSPLVHSRIPGGIAPQSHKSSSCLHHLTEDPGGRSPVLFDSPFLLGHACLTSGVSPNIASVATGGLLTSVATQMIQVVMMLLNYPWLFSCCL